MRSTLTDFDRAYHAALSAIDRGLLALSAVPYIHEYHEKRATAQQAFEAFTMALAAFDERPLPDAAWVHWRQEAADGQAAAKRYLG